MPLPMLDRAIKCETRRQLLMIFVFGRTPETYAHNERGSDVTNTQKHHFAVLAFPPYPIPRTKYNIRIPRRIVTKGSDDRMPGLARRATRRSSGPLRPVKSRASQCSPRFDLLALSSDSYMRFLPSFLPLPPASSILLDSIPSLLICLKTFRMRSFSSHFLRFLLQWSLRKYCFHPLWLWIRFHLRTWCLFWEFLRGVGSDALFLVRECYFWPFVLPAEFSRLLLKDFRECFLLRSVFVAVFHLVVVPRAFVCGFCDSLGSRRVSLLLWSLGTSSWYPYFRSVYFGGFCIRVRCVVHADYVYCDLFLSLWWRFVFTFCENYLDCLLSCLGHGIFCRLFPERAVSFFSSISILISVVTCY